MRQDNDEAVENALKELEILTAKQDEAKKDKKRRKAQKYQKEIDEINKHLPLDNKGESRKYPGRAETARQTVCSRIRDSLEHIKKEHPPLYKHLKSSIDLGNKICYKTDSSTPWIVTK